MNEVNKTLYIPLYGKSLVSRQKIILNDPTAEKIWEAEKFRVRGKSASKWLAYNMAMRARVFDDWTDAMLEQNKDAVVLHIGCGLDSRCKRVRQQYTNWVDCDLPEVISVRKKYYQETDNYHMAGLNAAAQEQVRTLPESDSAIVILEGISMYLTNEELHGLLATLRTMYDDLHILVDIYTQFGAKASKYKNPINEVGVTKVYGIDDMEGLIADLDIRLKAEHSFTPERLVNELRGSERLFFRLMFTGRTYGKIYRLFELESFYFP